MLDPDPQVCLVSSTVFQKAIQPSRQGMGTFYSPYHLQLNHFIYYYYCLTGPFGYQFETLSLYSANVRPFGEENEEWGNLLSSYCKSPGRGSKDIN